jgi:hypothetical protein
MAWKLNVSRLDDEGEFLSLFGQLVFSGVYATGGDGVGSFDFTGVNTALLPVFLSGQTQLHATRSAFEYSINFEAGFTGVIAGNLNTPGTPTGMKLKIWNTTTGAELAAGAYPAGGGTGNIIGNPYHSAMFKFKKNL